MKRLINILAFIALISVSFSCTPEEAKPIAEFKEKILNLHATQSVDVTVELDKAAVEPISIAISLDGEAITTTTMTVTPAAAEDFWNVFSAIFIDVPRNCCSSVGVRNISTQAIDVQNANLIVERVA